MPTPKSKIELVKDIFDTFAKKTKTFIFVNTKKSGEMLFNELKDYGLQVASIFSDTVKEDRDENIKKFRKVGPGSINTIIASSYLARGIDIPDIKLVINFDVPSSQEQGKTVPDFESYIHRIGRACRFDQIGLSLTLFDTE